MDRGESPAVKRSNERWPHGREYAWEYEREERSPVPDRWPPTTTMADDNGGGRQLHLGDAAPSFVLRWATNVAGC